MATDLFGEIRLPDELDPERERKGREATAQGWYIDPVNPDYSGNPQTKQEREWAANFVLEQGRLPTTQEASQWMLRTYGAPNRGIDINAPLEYMPGSTMYESGYRTQPEYFRAQTAAGGEPFLGPYAGKLTPEYGSVVLTDEKGKPLWRSTQAGGAAEPYIKRGQYITPPEGKTSTFGVRGAPRGYMSGEPGTELDVPLEGGRGAYYRREQPSQETEFQLPSVEEALRTRLDPKSAYAMRTQDYLDSLVARDAKRIFDIQQEMAKSAALYKKGEISKDNAQRFYDLMTKQLEGLWTQDRADAEAQRIGLMLQQGTSPETLPYYRESQQMTSGANVMGWWQKLSEQLGEEQRGNQEYSRQQAIAQSQGNAVQQQRYREQQQKSVTGRERTDFQTYVISLSLTDAAQSYLYNQYPTLLQAWQEAGMQTPFMDFVSDYLSGLWTEGNMPVYRQAERTSRLAPRTRTLSW